MVYKKKATAPVVEKTPVVEEAQDPKPTHCVRVIKVDDKNSLKKVIPIGPCTCEVCGYDPVTVNAQKFGTGTYEGLDEEGKLLARNLLKKHQERHSAAEVAAARITNLEISKAKAAKADQ